MSGSLVIAGVMVLRVTDLDRHQRVQAMSIFSV
jgi:hypothetical protein